MTNKNSNFTVRLFYSYSHKDQQHKQRIQESLSLLRRGGLLTQWSDKQIRPGQIISQRVREEIDRADILVFLLSPNFIASKECMKEWNYAKLLVSENKPVIRIPIILVDCAWKDLLESDDIKALPEDGNPVTSFDRAETAWHQIYEGLKEVINFLRNNFTPKSSFLNEIQKTEFLSHDNIELEDIFVFLTLRCYPPQTESVELVEKKLTSESQLLKKKYALIHGEEMSGKTALSRHLFLYLCQASSPVLLIDLNQITAGKPRERIFIRAHQEQFNGDYSLWKQTPNKTLILDNLSVANNSLALVLYAKQYFDNIIVMSSHDSFYSYFKDETRLGDFHEVSINPLTHVQQECLIRNRLALLEGNEIVTDGLVDQIENQVNSVIISNKIVPRYPFFVLSILQTYEAFMPDSLSISSYGHCYHALIVANLIKAGISKCDNDINACFNFAQKLAFRLYQYDKNSDGKEEFGFESFVSEYDSIYIISKSILNRLTHTQYGILKNNGRFRAPYMYYFFLGRFFSQDQNNYVTEIERLCDQSYVRSNHLILLFIIHHTSDIKIIDEILLRTMCTLDEVAPAVLNKNETKMLTDIVAGLPQSILSNKSVDHERRKDREKLDRVERSVEDYRDSQESAVERTNEHPANDVYRILKCNKVLGQILRNQYGVLERQKIEEIVEAITDGGLRLVNLVLKNESNIQELAEYLRQKHSNYDDRKIQSTIRWLSFVWTITHIESIVSLINFPEVRVEVSQVVNRQATPAYDLIGYFSYLDSAAKLTTDSQSQLARLLKKYDDPFIRNILSMRTQHYMNTHRSRAMIEQAICSLLNLRYVHRLGPLE